MSREVLLYFGWILLFLGGMIAISASGLVTQGSIPDPIYLRVGYSQLVGAIITAAGAYIIIRNK